MELKTEPCRLGKGPVRKGSFPADTRHYVSSKKSPPSAGPTRKAASRVKDQGYDDGTGGNDPDNVIDFDPMQTSKGIDKHGKPLPALSYTVQTRRGPATHNIKSELHPL